MTIAEICRAALAVSRSFAFQPEAAQTAELQLYRTVLALIADQGGEQGAMAETALEARPRAYRQGSRDGSLLSEATIQRGDRRRKVKQVREDERAT